MDACAKGTILGEIVVVVSNSRDAYALNRAKNAKIETLVFEPTKYKSRTLLCSKMAQELKNRNVDLLCLAGYMLKIEPCLIRSFPNRILNIHPALLPNYGGKGMYGHHVHKAVIDAKEKVSGCTVHMVDEIYDHGTVLAQSQVFVEATDTPESLAEKIHTKEHELYINVVRDVCSGKINLGSPS